MVRNLHGDNGSDGGGPSSKAAVRTSHHARSLGTSAAAALQGLSGTARGRR
jgi:hypothetical protein